MTVRSNYLNMGTGVCELESRTLLAAPEGSDVEPSDGAAIVLENAGSGLAMANEDTSGVDVSQQTLTKSTGQHWVLDLVDTTSNGGETYRIKNFFTGTYLTMNNPAKDGSGLSLQPYNADWRETLDNGGNAPSQHFYFNDFFGGGYIMGNRDNTNTVVETRWRSNDFHTPVAMWEWQNHAYQKWNILEGTVG